MGQKQSSYPEIGDWRLPAMSRHHLHFAVSAVSLPCFPTTIRSQNVRQTVTFLTNRYYRLEL
jgi:hypothetical protein